MPQLRQLTLQNITEWIMLHRYGAAFKKHTEMEVAQELFDCYKQGGLAVARNAENGEIEGVGTFERNEQYKLLQVKNVLVSKRGALKTLISIFTKNFPGWDIQTTRKDELIRYRHTDRLVKLINIRG